ncbi:MAG: methyltransferase [Alphaproteobacteria bacterium]|nr:methyltransferase [Alphaproteobacteria bacterium]
MDTTLDGLLNRRVTLEQPKSGYRVAVDTIFLAAAVPARTGERILDMGCGVGGALLCLARRVAGVKGTGIDVQPDLAELFRRNITRNTFAAGLEAQTGDVARLSPELHGAFDHVMANPPYHDEARHDVSANAVKQTANTEKSGDLALWVASAAAALKPSGLFTLIHRADRRDEILPLLQPAFGDIEILCLLPKENAEAKRVIIRARKGAPFSVREAAPLVLHKADGGYTQEADAVLRDCQEMLFQSP